MIGFWSVSTARGDKHPNTHVLRRVRREFEQAGAFDCGARRPAPGFEAAARLPVQPVPFGRAADGPPFTGTRTARRVFTATVAGPCRPRTSATPVIGPCRRPVRDIWRSPSLQSGHDLIFTGTELAHALSNA